MAYKGKFIPKNIEKYAGDYNKIRFLSLWERQLMRWLDGNSDVIKWSSEVPIKYVCGTDGNVHKYLIDFYIMWADGRKIMVEVKPKKQTISPPQNPKKRTRKWMNECLVYVKNISKWTAADKLCKDNGMVFEVWTEDKLTEMGLKILKPQGRK